MHEAANRHRGDEGIVSTMDCYSDAAALTTARSRYVALLTRLVIERHRNRLTGITVRAASCIRKSTLLGTVIGGYVLWFSSSRPQDPAS